MQIIYTDRSSAIRQIYHSGPSDIAVISISSSHGDYKKMRKKLDRFGIMACCFKFYDIDHHESGFTDDIAMFMHGRIKEWMKLSQDEKPKRILIHCDMGISRSGAVAKFINDYYKLGDKELNSYNLYNRYVYNRLMDATGEGLGKWYREGGALC